MKAREVVVVVMEVMMVELIVLMMMRIMVVQVVMINVIQCCKDAVEGGQVAKLPKPPSQRIGVAGQMQFRPKGDCTKWRNM